MAESRKDNRDNIGHLINEIKNKTQIEASKLRSQSKKRMNLV